jgi:hypothetical protein
LAAKIMWRLLQNEDLWGKNMNAKYVTQGTMEDWIIKGVKNFLGTSII